MDRVTSEESAANRARWLAELSDALEDAQHLVKAIAADRSRFEAAELGARIEALMAEVQMIRLSRPERSESFDPEWTGSLPWRLSA